MFIRAYLRAENEDGLELSFVIGKCRNAPMKQQTIPQLESSTLLGEIESHDHRRPRHTDPDSDTLYRLHDCSPVAALGT